AESQGYGPMEYLFVPAVVVTCIYLFILLLRRKKGDLIFFLAAFLVATLYVVFFTSRILMLLLLVTLTFMILTLRQLPSGRTLAITFLTFAALFFVGGILTLKGGSLQYSFTENLATMYDNSLSYIIAPTVALDQVVNSAGAHRQFITLRFFYA